ncbi:MAG: hypothetical protein LBD05_02000 [Mycoplasmataceae bacterium]|jgi:hypothetical protein|nr:hypothetical protein [Mycoplasmataceae bacterium]
MFGKNNNKTKKINKKDTFNIERVKVPMTKIISVNNVNFDNEIEKINEINSELNKLTKDELEYRLNFVEKDPLIIKKIKLILKQKNK